MTDRIRKLLIGILVPAVVGLGGVVLIIIALPDLPDPVAIHWGVTGQPDGFGPASTNLVLLILFTVLYSVFALVAARGNDGFSVIQKALLATAPFLAVLLTAVLAGSLVLQRGLADATQAPSVLPLLAVGAIAGVAMGIGAWFFLPAVTPRSAAETVPPTLELGATERAVWISSAGPAGMLTTLLLGSLALVGVVTIVAVVLAAPPLFALACCALIVFLSLLVASTVFWRVRVTDQGLVVRSALGIPRFAIPLTEVDEATVVTINPTRDFGGWGLRWGGRGRLGVVTRSGEALEVRRLNGKSLIVTVDGASNAAALLNALRSRAAV